MELSPMNKVLALAICTILAACQAVPAAQTRQRQDASPTNLSQARGFLTDNRNKEGVTESPSGLQYKVLSRGSGCQPAPDSTVRLHYQMSLQGNEQFLDDSRARGEEASSFDLREMIPAWLEAVPMMREGDTWELYVPPSLGYGATGSPPHIPPNSVMIFRIELVDALSCAAPNNSFNPMPLRGTG